MIFSLQNLGLSSGSYGEDYDIPRGNCFHSGKDYKTNQSPMTFLSAVYGKVVNPIGGEWGTISVVPFNSNDMIQYLHCSNIFVNVGDIVAPWTEIGKTGDVCPPGTCNGIHLHLHVVQPTGKPKYSCWNRNYINPNTWSYRNPLIGTWNTKYQTNGTPGSNVRLNEISINFIINSDLLATANYSITYWTIHVQSSQGLTCTIEVIIRNKILFSNYTKNGVSFRYIPDGYSLRTIPGTGTCNNLRVTQREQQGELILREGNQLSFRGIFDDRNFSKTLINMDAISDSIKTNIVDNDYPELILDTSTFNVSEPNNSVLSEYK